MIDTYEQLLDSLEWLVEETCHNPTDGTFESGFNRGKADAIRTLGRAGRFEIIDDVGRWVVARRVLHCEKTP